MAIPVQLSNPSPFYNGYGWRLGAPGSYVRYPTQMKIGDVIFGWRVKFYNSGYGDTIRAQMVRTDGGVLHNGIIQTAVGPVMTMRESGYYLEGTGFEEVVVHMQAYSILVDHATGTGSTADYSYNAEILFKRFYACP
jgi:hypothetical protein